MAKRLKKKKAKRRMTSKQVRKLFFKHKKKHPESVPADKLTSLAKRMQSGRA